jgi:hypothetical protein
VVHIKAGGFLPAFFVIYAGCFFRGMIPATILDWAARFVPLIRLYAEGAKGEINVVHVESLLRLGWEHLGELISSS